MTALVASLSLFMTQSVAYALPTGGVVGGGSADISYAGGRVDITQSTQRAVIDWSSFNVGAGEAVQFNQPSVASIALNRIHDVNPSSSTAPLSANGQVWLVNPNGMMFGKRCAGQCRRPAGDDERHRQRPLHERRLHVQPSGQCQCDDQQRGHITVVDGGLAALVGPNVSNDGLIEARLGKVALASGDTFTLDLYGDGLINLAATPAMTQRLVQNGGIIRADGGKVLMTAAAADTVVTARSTWTA